LEAARARPIRFAAGQAPRDAALTAGFHRVLLACAIFLLAAAVIALRATNSHGEPATEPSGIPAGPGQVPAPELAG
jgi:hypothetical protein